MKNLTSDRDLYDDVIYMNDPEGWEREQSRRKKEDKEKRRKEFWEKWKSRILTFFGKTIWAVYIAIIGALVMWISKIVTGK